MPKQEERLQLAVSRYLQIKYPKVIFTTDASGLRLTIGQAVKLKAQRNPSKGLPDMLIFNVKFPYNGLLMELKPLDKSPYLKDGLTLDKNSHIQEQAKVHETLRAEGYWCDFVVGLDQAIQVIDDYMKLNF